MMSAMALAPGAVAQTNLLTNGGLDINDGFAGDCQPFWGNFCGFPGWNSDFADDGVFNGSWQPDAPGGFRLANVFPTGANDVKLTGPGSMLILGSFDGSVPSVLLQQVEVQPGQSIRGGIFAYSDTTKTNTNGFPDTIYGQFSRNRLRMRIEFFDEVGIGGFLEDQEVVIFDPENDPGFNTTTFKNPLFEDKWIEAARTVTVPAFAKFARLAVIFDQVNNAGGLAFMDTASIVNLSAGAPLTGDFDFDGALSADDLRMITLAAGGTLKPADNRFDLTGDMQVTSADIAAWQNLAVTPGDFSGDGKVDAADLTLLLNNWGATVPPTPAGWNGAAPTAPAIDANELTALLNNWGVGTSASGATAAPEPATWMLVVVGGAAALLRRQC